MTNTPDRYLTVNEVAEICRVTPEAVRAWLRANRLPAVRIGGYTLRIRQSALDAFTEPATFPTDAFKDAR